MIEADDPPNQTTEIKIRFNLPERRETEKPNHTRTKERKIIPIYYNKHQQFKQSTSPSPHKVELLGNRGQLRGTITPFDHNPKIICH